MISIKQQQHRNISCVSLAWRLWRKACCSATNSLIRLLTSLTTRSVDCLASVQLNKHSRSYVSISLINLLDALWMFSSAVSRAMSTCWRRESQCSRIFHSDTLNILSWSADESPICARSDFNFFAIELEIKTHVKWTILEKGYHAFVFSRYCVFTLARLSIHLLAVICALDKESVLLLLPKRPFRCLALTWTHFVRYF